MSLWVRALRYEAKENVFRLVRIPYKKLTAQRLAEAITAALSPDAKLAATKLGQAIRQEVRPSFRLIAYLRLTDFVLEPLVAWRSCRRRVLSSTSTAASYAL